VIDDECTRINWLRASDKDPEWRNAWQAPSIERQGYVRAKGSRWRMIAIGQHQTAPFRTAATIQIALHGLKQSGAHPEPPRREGNHQTMSRTRKTLITVAMVLGLSALLLLTTAASASEDSSEEHCGVQVLDQKDSGEFILSKEVCFAEFDDMVAHFDSGTDADYIIGTHYEHSNLNGSSFNVWGSSCIGGWLNVSGSWDNRISSTANGCYRIKHWEDTGTSGARKDTFSPWGNISGVMNDETSSISYHGS